MALMKFLLVFHFTFCSIYIFCGKASTSEDELELEAQLKILNKPTVKTFVTKEGDTIDCIDIHKQPALDHPLLKDHKVQRKPNFRFIVNHRTSSNAKSVKFGLREPCPFGTVPIPRVSKEDLIRARSIPKMPSVSAMGQNAQANSNQHLVYLRLDDVKHVKYGAGATMNIYNLTVSHEQSSCHNIWIETNVADHLSMIVAGWQVCPKLYGDTLPHLFIFWTGNGYRDGCYNVLCPGFVQVDKEVTLGYPFHITSIYGGTQYELVIRIEQDETDGNWWLIVNENPEVKVGYLPKELFMNLRNGAAHTSWGGVGLEDSNGVCPPMGSGHKPDGDLSHGGYFRRPFYILSKRSLHYAPLFHTSEWVDKSHVYELAYDHLHLILNYGGPGGYCRG